jgi:cyanate permease
MFVGDGFSVKFVGAELGVGVAVGVSIGAISRCGFWGDGWQVSLRFWRLPALVTLISWLMVRG